jgi:NDP-sugar pyrophosphorylase family protein
MKPTLLVLAAGMGSRYGGLKQLDSFGPNGETIIDYSLYDAIDAGFGKVVFIIRESFSEEFRARFDPILKGKIEVEYVNQELTTVPGEFMVPKDRTKPWGTGHAVWVAHEVINEPFGVINADDFYGREAYFQLADYLRRPSNSNYSVVAYKLINTLSDHGTVNRGVCESNGNGKLLGVVECIKIGNEDGVISYPNEDGTSNLLDRDTLVSMNMWGFQPSYFDYTEESFSDFLSKHGQESKSEFYIPNVVDDLIQADTLAVDIVETNAGWFGVTYPDDKPHVMEAISQLIDKGVYPKSIWQK